MILLISRIFPHDLQQTIEEEIFFSPQQFFSNSILEIVVLKGMCLKYQYRAVYLLFLSYRKNVLENAEEGKQFFQRQNNFVHLKKSSSPETTNAILSQGGNAEEAVASTGRQAGFTGRHRPPRNYYLPRSSIYFLGVVFF